MRIPSVFAIVVLASVSTATAQPKPEENNERIRYGQQAANDKAGRPRDPGHQDGAWLQLATPTPTKHGTEYVVVGKDQGTFAKIRLDADKGTVIVRKVKIYFDGGKRRDIDLDIVLNDKHKSTEIDLGAPQAIDRIVVTTDVQHAGEYAVYGSSAGGTVATER